MCQLFLERLENRWLKVEPDCPWPEADMGVRETAFGLDWAPVRRRIDCVILLRDDLEMMLLMMAEEEGH